ncbi:phospholipase ABHD3-like isoform X2 [Halichondria panicea]|uniref:phospholipase ABHD3-like isoform X2 n=1 Tax=Halichondria panicea TaxID=6063 RepID=UPI00312B623B
MDMNMELEQPSISDSWPWSGLEDMSFDSVQWSLPETGTPLKVIILLLSFYILYYLSCVVNKPKLVGGEKGLQQYLIKHCPVLTERYWPKIWAFQCHFMTILRAAFQKCPNSVVKYNREILPLDDGGEVALDWACQQGSVNLLNSSETTPVLLILPGITGKSQDNYLMHLSQDGILTGYRPVVFNQRGNGGLFLKTMRTYSASDISDLSEVVHRIQCLYPEAPIVGLGVSLGGMILTQYLHKLGNKCNLNAAIAISMVWDPFKTRESLENRIENRNIYVRFMSTNLRSMVRRNVERLSSEEKENLPFCYETVMTTKTITEFDEHVTAPMFGFSSVDEYYKESRNSDKIHKICRPYICITSADDPFVPKESIPETGFIANPNTLLVMTSHGGHFGFLEGLSPTINSTWMNRICRQLLTALKNYD